MTTYGKCRHQIAKMVSRSLFLFPVYKRHFVFYGDHYVSVSDIRPLDWASLKNVGIAAGISQICYF